MNEPTPGKAGQTYSIASIIAIVAAIATFFVGAGAQFFIAIIAIIFGVIGMILALSPKVRGGIASTIAVIIALIAVVVAILRGIMHLF